MLMHIGVCFQVYEITSNEDLPVTTNVGEDLPEQTKDMAGSVTTNVGDIFYM